MRQLAVEPGIQNQRLLAAVPNAAEHSDMCCEWVERTKGDQSLTGREQGETVPADLCAWSSTKKPGKKFIFCA